MPINNITQTISELPAAGKRGIDVQTQFVIKQEDFQDHLQGTTVTELNTFKNQLNLRIGEINSTTTTMNGYADTASAGASTATTKAGEASTSATEALTSKNQASTFATNSSNSATKSSQWADNNYNVAVETGKYSAKHWATEAQNTVANKVDKVISTDNAIVRFDGTTGVVQNSNVIIDDAGNVGIGVTPSAWAVGKAIQYTNGSSVSGVGNSTMTMHNAYYDGAFKYIGAGYYATQYEQNKFAGTHNWRTAPSGTAGNPITWTDAMTLEKNGNLLVGTTTDNGVDKLQVNGHIRNTGDINTGGKQYNIWSDAPQYEIVNRGNVAKAFQWYVGANGSAPIASLTTSGVWTNASDKRNKTNIKDIPYGLSTVMSLSPKEYDLKSDGTHAIGFIAQDVKEIIPELVFEEKEGAFLTLDYASMVTVLVKAMQEQQAQIEELRLSIEGK
jgi:hypothetical protein